jgi:DNA (cytosine-5)-methyltransferase 1
MTHAPTHVDLFSGIGGFALAAKWAGFRTVAFCEIDKYCRKVLAKNFNCHTHGKSEPTLAVNAALAELCGNIFEFDGTQYRGVDLITGGFPCQPFSVAGKRRGAADDRALWPEMLRVISEARPAWILGENVTGIIPMELDNVLSDLESIGYATRSFVIPACAVDARHRRDRVWILAYRASERREQYAQLNGESKGRIESSQRNNVSGRCEWLPEPAILRVAHGIPNRVDRLRGLGNAIVPQVAYQILKEIRRLI